MTFSPIVYWLLGLLALIVGPSLLGFLMSKFAVFEPAIMSACEPPSLDIVSLSFLALVVSSFYVAFFYLWKKLTGTADAGGSADVWVKGELYEIGATAFIVLFFIPLFINTACAFSLGPYNIFETSIVFLRTLSTNIVVIIQLLVYVYTAFDFFVTFETNFVPLGFGIAGPPFGGSAYIWKPIFSQMANFLTISYLMTEAQVILFEFFTYGLVKFFLPLGVLLRSFTPTRRMGGMIIGFVLGILILYPLILTFNYFVFEEKFLIKWDTRSDSWDNGAYEGLLNELEATLNDVGAIFTGMWNDILNKGKEVIGGEFKPDQLWRLLYIPAILGFAIWITASTSIALIAILLLVAAWRIILYAVFFGIVAGIIMPAINAIILIQGVRYFTYVFGEELDITTLTRLV